MGPDGNIPLPMLVDMSKKAAIMYGMMSTSDPSVGIAADNLSTNLMEMSLHTQVYVICATSQAAELYVYCRKSR